MRKLQSLSARVLSRGRGLSHLQDAIVNRHNQASSASSTRLAQTAMAVTMRAARLLILHAIVCCSFLKVTVRNMPGPFFAGHVFKQTHRADWHVLASCSASFLQPHLIFR